MKNVRNNLWHTGEAGSHQAAAGTAIYEPAVLIAIKTALEKSFSAAALSKMFNHEGPSA